MGETDKDGRNLRAVGRVGWMEIREGFRLFVLGVMLANVCAGGTVSAADLTPFMGRPATQRKHFQGDAFARAGDPQRISPLARPTESPHEFGYFVGGGARERSRLAQRRYPQEGVWGTDYAGAIIPKHVRLGWWHGRQQGGTGSYATDGPRLIRGH